jgi:hypothetical protein
LAVIQVEYEKVKAEHDKVNSELQKSTTVRNAYIIHCNIYIVLN